MLKFWRALDGQQLLVVEGLAAGGGDAGSLTPRCSATCVSVFHCSVWIYNAHRFSAVSETTTTTTTTRLDRFAFPFFTSDLSVGSMSSARCAEGAGTAKRWRERRFTPVPSARTANRRHAPGETRHDAAPSGQNKARSRREVRVARHGHDPKEPLPQPELFDVFGEESGGVRPAPLSEVAGWHDRVERHTGEHIDEICPCVPILDVPVPQMGEQLVNFFRFLDVQSPVEQVIDLPKILEDSIQQRLVDRDSRVPQMAEQLVAVPTVLTLVVLAEQIVDIRVPRGRGVHGGLQGFHPRQSSTASSAEQIVDFLVGEGFQDVLPNPHSAAPFAFWRGEPNQGVFRTFPPLEKVRRSAGRWVPESSRTPASR